MIEFTKLGDGLPKDGVKEASEDHRIVHDGKDKLFLVSLKGVEQKKASFFHRTALCGGYVASFDLSSKTWAPAVEFPAIDEDENREDFMFGLNGRLLMLVYSRYERFQIRGVYEWTPGSGKKWTPLTLNIESDFAFDTFRAHVAAYHEPGTNDVYLLTDEEGVAGKITIDKDSAKVSKICNTTMTQQSVMSMGMPMALAKHGNKLFATIGVQGCGVRWEADKLLQVSIDGKSTGSVDVKNEGPGYSFGPLESAVIGGKWYALGGSRPVGMASSKSSTEIWSIDLDKLEWSGAPVGNIPAELDSNAYSTTFDASAGTVYAHDRKGLFSAKV